MDEQGIQWPVELSDDIKAQLLSLAKPLTTVKEFEVTSDYWKLDGLFYIQSGVFTIGYIAEDLNLSISAVLGAGVLFSKEQLSKLFIF